MHHLFTKDRSQLDYFEYDRLCQMLVRAEPSGVCAVCDKPEQECGVLPGLLTLKNGNRKLAYLCSWEAHLHAGLRQALDRSTGADSFLQLQKAGVPSDLLLGLRRNLDATGCLQAAQRFKDAGVFGGNPDMPIITFLVLVGKIGVGKSLAAAWVLWQFARRYPWNEQTGGGQAPIPCMWVPARSVTARVEFGAVEPAWVEQMQRAQLLVLDDLGQEGGEVAKLALRDVIASRFERRRRTVLTSNLEPSDFRTRYGEALADRLATSGIIPELAKEKNRRKRG